MAFIGYTVILAVIIFLIILSEKILKKKLDREYCRKLLHIGTFSVYPIAEIFFEGKSTHFAIVCAVFAVATLILYLSGAFKNIDGRKEKYPGIFYYALSLLIISLFCCYFDSMRFCLGIGFIGLAFGDGFATLFGYTFGKRRIHGGKTLEGFLSCILFTAIPLFIYNAIIGSPLPPTAILALSLLAAITELVDLGLDNLLIPLSLFFVGYCVTVSTTVLIALIIAECVFCIAFFSRLIEYYGSLLASFIGFMFYLYGGISGIGFVIGCYAVMITVSLIGKALKNDISSMVKKTKGKDITEIFVNGAWALLAIILYALTKNNAFFAISLISMSGGFVDSLASDIGTLSKKRPYDIFKRIYVEKGESGGMTLLGSLSSLIGAVLFALAVTLICSLPAYCAAVITAITYTGCLADTAMGSLFQVKYRCNTCGRITEREEHCGNPTEKIGGITFMNNDTVNLLSGAIVFLLAFTVFILIGIPT